MIGWLREAHPPADTATSELDKFCAFEMLPLQRLLRLRQARLLQPPISAWIGPPCFPLQQRCLAVAHTRRQLWQRGLVSNSVSHKTSVHFVACCCMTWGHIDSTGVATTTGKGSAVERRRTFRSKPHLSMASGSASSSALREGSRSSNRHRKAR